MSSYTMQLKTYIEKWSQYQDDLTLNEKIEIGRPHLFDFPYPIFDENYKKILETNFIRNFYMREIGFETEGLFKLRLENWFNIHMPYFNKMFESELIDFDPLKNSEVDVTHNKKNDSTGNASSTGTGESNATSEGTGKQTNNKFDRNIKADTPADRLALTTNDGEGILEYASEISERTDNDVSDTEGTETSNATTNTTQNTDNTLNSVEDFIQHRAGKIGVQSYSKMVMEYRESFLRIERDMHKELQKLFMLVY